jgi:hypothetical protein
VSSSQAVVASVEFSAFSMKRRCGFTVDGTSSAFPREHGDAVGFQVSVSIGLI